MKVIFSPCLYCRSNELFDLYLLNDSLDFIVKYLDGSLDDYEDAFYNDNRLFSPPIMDNINEYMQYLSITTNIYKLKADGENIFIQSHNNQYNLLSTDFNIVHTNEFQILVDYLHQLYIDDKLKDMLMFIGEANSLYKKDDYKERFVKIEIEGNVYIIPIIKDLLLDESDNYNPYIKKDFAQETLFVYKDLCIGLVEKMYLEIDWSQYNGTSFKKYGEIIAHRNNFEDYEPKSPYDTKTKYFKRKDNSNIISIDLKHGHFEIFDCNIHNPHWIAKYSFRGEELDAPTDAKTLSEIRSDHKVEKQ